jgi:hypothetical protein
MSGLKGSESVNLKTAEDKARLSIIVAIVGLVFAIGAALVLLRNFRSDQFIVLYNAQTMWLPAFAGTALLGLGASAAAFFLGLNSAAARRNQQVGKSWLGFFLGAGGVTVAMSVLVFFYFTRSSI